MPVEYIVSPIGIIHSPLKRIEDCPLQGEEGAPTATIEFNSEVWEGVEGLTPGTEVLLFTWFHLADRDVIKCHKRNFVDTPKVGVFTTRSPDRPNPIGLHRGTVMEIGNDRKIKVSPLEALDQTPVIDIKPV